MNKMRNDMDSKLSESLKLRIYSQNLRISSYKKNVDCGKGVGGGVVMVIQKANYPIATTNVQP